MNPGAIFQLFKDTYNDWSEDKAPRLGAALAYYTVFSLAPLLVLAISLSGLFLGEEAARGQIVDQMRGLVGEEGAEGIQEMIQAASARKTGGAVATAIGIATLLFGASGVFGQLHDALNTIWEVEAKPGRGVLGVIKDRFISFTMVLGVGFLLLVALVISAVTAGLGKFLGGMLPVPEFVLQAVNLVISFAVVTLLFAMIYKVLPDVEIKWGDVWIGAAVTALLFTIGKFLLGLYLGRGSVGSAYGAAGSLIVVLLWVYYSAQILFFGAEFTQVYARRYGSGVVPAEDAVPVTEEARAKQGMPESERVAAVAQGQEPQPARRGTTSAASTTREGATPQTAQPSTRQTAQPSTYKYVGAAAGAASLTFIVGLFVGAVGSIFSLIVGAVRGVRR